jgi:hypothetical protein
LRSKDIYDLFDLAATHSWSAQRLNEAVQLTFIRRQTAIPKELPIMFTPAFYQDVSKLSQWEAFKKRIRHSQLGTLQEVLLRLHTFWWPLLKALATEQAFEGEWNPNLWDWVAEI